MISVSYDFRQMKKGMDDFAKTHLPEGIRIGLNKIAYETMLDQRVQADKNFDGGATRWTKSGFIYNKVKGKILTSSVYYLANTRPYLKTVFEGGMVTPKGRSLVQPVQIKLNKYGNIPRGKIRNLTKDKKRYFVGAPKNWGVNGNDRYAGVWKRSNDNRRLDMVARFKDSRTQKVVYSPSYYANKFQKKYFNKYMQNAIDYAVDRALSRL